MPKARMRQAVRQALHDEMQRDPTVVLIGEDIAVAGGAFKATEGLLEAFGSNRVRDTPISETAILGAGLGAAATGLRPVVEMMFIEFIGVALDQLVTEAAKFRYLSRGRITVPLTVRASAGAGQGFGCQHSQMLDHWFRATPGLKLVVPSSPQTAYGLLRSAIQDPDPVVFLEPRALYGERAEVEYGDQALIPLGLGATVQHGDDLTVVSAGQLVARALAAADGAPWSADVIDLQTLVPWDRTLVLESVTRTGRLVVVEEAPYSGGWGKRGDGLRQRRAVRPAAGAPAPDHDTRHPRPVRRGPRGGLAPFGLLHPYPDRRAARERPPTLALVAARAGDLHVTLSTQRERRQRLDQPLGLYERMLEVRRAEEVIQQMYADGTVRGSTHLSNGQEAVAVGIAAASRPEDTVTCTYRGHGVALALGMTPTALFAELAGRRAGCTGGLGGSMHLSDADIGLLPTVRHRGRRSPGRGGRRADRPGARDRQRGDRGLRRRGDEHRSVPRGAQPRRDLAAARGVRLREQPLRRVQPHRAHDTCQRPRIARLVLRHARRDRRRAGRPRCEGRDGRGAGPRARRGRSEPAGDEDVPVQRPLPSDPAGYRLPGELDQWLARDPVMLYRQALLARSDATEAELATVDAQVDAALRDALAEALDSPVPAVRELLDDVLSGGGR
jgi:pyruvate dehydrogenase E1 component beta subunit